MGCKAFFFSIPFIIAGTCIITIRDSRFLKRYYSLANEEEPLGVVGIDRLLQIQSSFTAFGKGSRTVHTSEQSSEQQADLSDGLSVSIGVLALILRPFSRPTEV